MKLQPIVNSLLDTDLYKITMGQCVFHKHTDLNGEYHFKCRNENVRFTKDMIQEIKEQVDHLCGLTYSKDELDWLRSIRFIKSDYVEFLRLWRPLRDYVEIREIDEAPGMEVIVKGPIFSAMPFEIYLLEIINEVYFRMKYDYDVLRKSAEERLNEKINKFNTPPMYGGFLWVNNEGEAVGKTDSQYSFKFAEFGCRRRLSREWQDEVVRRFATELKDKNCVGTSNMYLAMKYGLTPIGTYAHEFVQMYQGIPSIPLAYTNYYALQDWYAEYRGDLGTALTDTLGTKLFLLDFDRAMANNFTGVRHDSGDPYVWGDMIIEHYKKFGIDPKTKTLLFSDSLDFDKAQKLYNYFKDKTKVSFGIGTYCTNDTCESALNIVLKLQYVNGKPVAKMSDCYGKTMCSDEAYLKYLRNAIEYRLDNSEEIK